MVAPAATRVVLTDANVLINLIHVRRLGLLGSLRDHAFVVPPEVVAEVSVPAQAQQLAHAIDVGYVRRTAFSDPEELRLFAEFVRTIGKGEAACLAIAEVRGWYVASDERGRFRRLAVARLGAGRLLNTAGLYVLAIRAGALTVAEADQDKRLLEKHRFKMRFPSFAERLGGGAKE